MRQRFDCKNVAQYETIEIQGERMMMWPHYWSEKGSSGL